MAAAGAVAMCWVVVTVTATAGPAVAAPSNDDLADQQWNLAQIGGIL